MVLSAQSNCLIYNDIWTPGKWSRYIKNSQNSQIFTCCDFLKCWKWPHLFFQNKEKYPHFLSIITGRILSIITGRKPELLAQPIIQRNQRKLLGYVHVILPLTHQAADIDPPGTEPVARCFPAVPEGIIWAGWFGARICTFSALIMDGPQWPKVLLQASRHSMLSRIPGSVLAPEYDSW